MESKTTRRRWFKKGTRVTTFGNHERTGAVLGHFENCYVVQIDTPIRIQHPDGIELVSILLSHFENTSKIAASEAAH